jgi:hypothetical protein
MKNKSAARKKFPKKHIALRMPLEQKWTIELINDIAGDDMSVSQFIRTAIKEKINGWKERKRMDGVSDINQMVQRHINEERKAFEEEKSLDLTKYFD